MEKFLETEKETLEKYMVKFEGKEDEEQDDALFSDVESAESSYPENEESMVARLTSSTKSQCKEEKEKTSAI